MHLRLLSCLGLPVVEEGSDTALGFLSGILIDPDSGNIEGFFVRVPGFLDFQEVFCSFLDIVRWGTRVHVRDADVLSPVEERIRLAPLLEDNRTVIGQKIQTQSGIYLGCCRDVQFNTDSMKMEWVFPKKFFRWGIALPAKDIQKITEQAIIVKDQVVKEEEIIEEESTGTIPAVPELSESTLGRKKGTNGALFSAKGKNPSLRWRQHR